MKYGYICKIDSAKEFQQQVMMFGQKGITIDNMIVRIDFNDFCSSLAHGDRVVVCSYVDVFSSFSNYLATAIELIDRGIVIESIQEPGVTINNSNSEFVRELNNLNCKLRSTTSRKGIIKAKTEGRTLGRPRGSIIPEIRTKVKQVDKLCKESGISVLKACHITGCVPRTYYRHKNQTQQLEK